LETFTTLLSGHLDTFRELERLQMTALEGLKNQGIEGLSAMLSSQQEILGAIAREKAGLRPYLDEWEGLKPEDRAKLRAGRPGEILDALEAVAKGIQSRHQEMFGADDAVGAAQGGATGPGSPGATGQESGGKDPAAKSDAQPDLSQMIHLYRSMQ
jgi:hypothetical protein